MLGDCGVCYGSGGAGSGVWNGYGWDCGIFVHGGGVSIICEAVSIDVELGLLVVVEPVTVGVVFFWGVILLVVAVGVFFGTLIIREAISIYVVFAGGVVFAAVAIDVFF